MSNQNGYWVNGKFYPSDESTTTAVELKQRVGVDVRRQLIALMPDGTWMLVQDHEQVSTAKVYEHTASFTYGQSTCQH